MCVCVCGSARLHSLVACLCVCERVCSGHAVQLWVMEAAAEHYKLEQIVKNVCFIVETSSQRIVKLL